MSTYDPNQYCVILAGGAGNRFWPVCRESRPKQFIEISSDGVSFLRTAYERVLGVFLPENIIVITLERYAGIVREQIPELPEGNLLLEPYGRKTAPCIVYATYSILKRNPAAVVTVTPSDIVIDDDSLFRGTLRKAMDYALAEPVLMTLGIVPTRPDTGYGYIQIKGGKAAYTEDKPIKVKTFTEKPDPEIARVFYGSGEFFWNSGIFVWKASVIREEMERYIPEISSLFTGWESALGSPAEKLFIQRAYTDCAKISIDYGVMEKTERAWMYPAKFGWSDIDSWESLYAARTDKDTDGNICHAGKHCLEDVKGNVILTSEKRKLVAIKGMEDYLIIDTPDVLLICPKDDKKYKDFITRMAMPGYDEYR